MAGLITASHKLLGVDEEEIMKSLKDLEGE